MRVFDHPNPIGFECPICRSAKDAPVVLVPLPWTQRGNIVEAKQFHKKCYDLWLEMQRG